MPWPRALALLALGCLALGAALGCGVLAGSLLVTALIEPRDVVTAARDALIGILLLGAGMSAGLAWAIFAAVIDGIGAGAFALRRRGVRADASEGAMEVVLG